jgi:hypothetical protein
MVPIPILDRPDLGYGFFSRADLVGGGDVSAEALLAPFTTGDRLIGVGGTVPPQDATAAFGRETLEAAADIVVREVRHRLEHPELYRPHGAALQEGLWRAERP